MRSLFLHTAFAISVAVPAALATPCDPVDRSLTPQRQAALSRVVAVQLRRPMAEVKQSVRYRGWTILYVTGTQTDEPFLFYGADPSRSRFVTLWSGGAAQDEGPGIRRWVLAHARGIPPVLAACFAWHVTEDRDP